MIRSQACPKTIGPNGTAALIKGRLAQSPRFDGCSQVVPDILRARKVVIALEQPGPVHQILITGRLDLEKAIHHWTIPAVERMLLLLARHLTSFRHSSPEPGYRPRLP